MKKNVLYIVRLFEDNRLSWVFESVTFKEAKRMLIEWQTNGKVSYDGAVFAGDNGFEHGGIIDRMDEWEHSNHFRLS